MDHALFSSNTKKRPRAKNPVDKPTCARHFSEHHKTVELFCANLPWFLVTGSPRGWANLVLHLTLAICQSALSKSINMTKEEYASVVFNLFFFPQLVGIVFLQKVCFDCFTKTSLSYLRISRVSNQITNEKNPSEPMVPILTPFGIGSHTLAALIPTRWFKGTVLILIPSWRSPKKSLKGHFIIPKKGHKLAKNCQAAKISYDFCFFKMMAGEKTRT